MKVCNTRYILVDINGEAENCSMRENLKARISKNMQIVLNARKRNTKKDFRKNANESK